jgi:hypothetical protein
MLRDVEKKMALKDDSSKMYLEESSNKIEEMKRIINILED